MPLAWLVATHFEATPWSRPWRLVMNNLLSQRVFREELSLAGYMWVWVNSAAFTLILLCASLERGFTLFPDKALWRKEGAAPANCPVGTALAPGEQHGAGRDRAEQRLCATVEEGVLGTAQVEGGVLGPLQNVPLPPGVSALCPTAAAAGPQRTLRWSPHRSQFKSIEWPLKLLFFSSSFHFTNICVSRGELKFREQEQYSRRFPKARRVLTLLKRHIFFPL